jgi:hypothetical protein
MVKPIRFFEAHELVLGAICGDCDQIVGLLGSRGISGHVCVAMRGRDGGVVIGPYGAVRCDVPITENRRAGAHRWGGHGGSW